MADHSSCESKRVPPPLPTARNSSRDAMSAIMDLPMARGGRIELVTGPMFSGKSTELLRRIRRYRYARKECLLIKFQRDTRYSEDCVATHDRVMLKAVSCGHLSEVAHLVSEFTVIGIDEGQFFEDLIPFCNELAKRGKVMVVAALDGTFAAQPFGGVCDMIPLSCMLDKLTAVCAGCGADAEFSKRLSADTAVEMIGGSDTYSPMCRSCYHGLEAPRQRGRVELVVGPMFSGKSTELLRRIRRYRYARKQCLLIKYKKDTRYSSDCVSTHDRVMLKAVSCDTLEQVSDLVGEYGVIGIDEGQFFPDLLVFVNRMANLGKTVVIAALDGTFEASPFGDVCKLVPYSSCVTKLRAVCALCSSDAAFSKRLSTETAVEVIGGSDTYAPMCRSCYFDIGRPMRSPLPVTPVPSSPAAAMLHTGGTFSPIVSHGSASSPPSAGRPSPLGSAKPAAMSKADMAGTKRQLAMGTAAEAAEAAAAVVPVPAPVAGDA